MRIEYLLCPPNPELWYKGFCKLDSMNVPRPKKTSPIEGDDGVKFSIHDKLKHSLAHVALRVKLLRQAMGYTQDGFAVILGCHRATLIGIEAGTKPIQPHILTNIRRHEVYAAIIDWVDTWVIKETSTEFMDNLQAVNSQELDLLDQALFALGSTCGPKGWIDFWDAIGYRLCPLPPFTSRPDAITQTIASHRRYLNQAIKNNDLERLNELSGDLYLSKEERKIAAQALKALTDG